MLQIVAFFFFFFGWGDIIKLCSAVVTKTVELCPSFLSQAREISVKFEQVFKLFAACHFVYDSADYLNDSNIDKIGKRKKKPDFRRKHEYGNKIMS